MKKSIFTLLIVFFAISIAVNAQNQSKVSYNTDGSVILSEELKAKPKVKDISEVQYLEQSSQTNTKNLSKPKLKQPIKQTKTVKKSVIKNNQSQSLVDQAKQMNIDFAKKGLQYKTQIKTIGGKQYIEIVDLPQQIGMKPAKSKQ